MRTDDNDMSTTATPTPELPATQAAEPAALTIRQKLGGEAFKAAIAQVLPKHLTPDRMVRVAILAITRTPKLQKCDQASFFNAMMTLSQLGLEPDGRRAHLIPFENRKRGVTECQLIVDYKGLVELASRSGAVSNIHADVVCENDVFDVNAGELVRHTIDYRKPRGEVFAAYALARMKDGGTKLEVMSRDEIEDIRKRSRSGGNGPWMTDWNEMAKKTVFRRLSKWLPLASEYRDALDAEDEIHAKTRPVVPIDAPEFLIPETTEPKAEGGGE